MGNFISCCSVESQTAKIIDLHGNIRIVEIPSTAADLMLEEPGHVVSPAVEISGSDSRFSAMKADEELTAGEVYIWIPVRRVHSKVSESEMAVIKASAGDGKAKRCSSKVLPVVTESSDEEIDTPVKLILNQRLRPWKPALEPISEGI
ncbi:uncharacterized protein LOC111405741 [Olea europaea var. sylvestris]|uniref:uncharacterized protein LOC111405741 n=1 Tax=Olea europaea var. sylvestris TaxID=158386 RepID=UPI000C1D5239|nr:uncharacterized protein LOC111405741 [Olea europaea var. sylvestris]